MCEISEIQDYLQKWAEAERDLAINGVWPQCYPLQNWPLDTVEKDIPPELLINEDRP
jgi:hypothetical protein